MGDFAHLHVHSQFSLLDSALRIEDMLQTAHDDKMTAVGLTDHGNLFGALDFYTKAKEYGIKPILGCEFYLAPGNRKTKGTTTSGDDEVAPYATSRSGMHHLILLCMNEVGYRNLSQLVSSGYLEGFYYKPRIDKEILAQYSEGLVATSACLKSEMAALCLLGDMDRARETLKWYRDLFQGRFYLELQQNGLPQQMIVNQRYQELGKELNVPLIATADCHYLTKKDAFSQEVLMAVQTGRTLNDPSGENLRSDEFYFKPQDVIKREFSFCPEAISNTMKIADLCDFEFKFEDENKKKIYHFPKFEPPEGKTQVEHLCELSKRGLEQRLYEREALSEVTITEEEKKKYEARLDRELSVINQMGFTGYFLIVADFIKYAKDNGVPVGPGRGSGAGSLVAFVLKITELDPIEHGLLFERFLNPERISLPDFDIDFCMDKRDRVIQYVSQKYGKDCVAQIITFGKLQARGVIRDVGRAFGMPIFEVDKIAKLVPETLNITLEEALQQEPRLKQLTETDPKIFRLFEICQALEGLTRHASIHAAGLVISNRPMVEHCPLYRGKNDELVIQFDMTNADRIGLIKFDFLGLKTLTFLQAAEALVNQRHPENHFDLNRLTLTDKPTYEMLAKGDTQGVFQLESSGMQDLMKKLRPDVFEDIVASNALYRPGPIGSGMLDDFITRKHGQVPVIYDFESLRPVLQETYGVIVYQEQVQQIAMTLANYTAGSADLLRRAMGKKKPEEMAKQKEIFISGAVQNKYDRAKAEKLFDLMAMFAGYGFNKSHAAAYSLVTYQTAYLKAHYPVEFFATLLSIEKENTDKITRYIGDANRHGIQVLPPDINESETDFTVLSETQIRFGLGAIKGLGQVAIDSILEARKKSGKFADLYDLCSKTNNRSANKRALEAMIKAAAFDSFGIHRAALMKAVDGALDMGSSLQKSRDDKQPSFSDLLGMEEEIFSSRKVSYPDAVPWGRMEELRYEKETIGFFLTGHPLDEYEEQLKRFTTFDMTECISATQAADCMVGVDIRSLREIMTKKGDRMAFATLADRMGEIDCVIFSDVYVENEALLKCGEPLWIRGQLQIEANGNKILLSKKNNAKILPLKYAYEAIAREMHLYWKAGNSKIPPKAQIEKLQSILQTSASKEGVPVYLHLNIDGKAETVLKMKEAIPIKREVVESIEKVFEGGDKAGGPASIEFR